MSFVGFATSNAKEGGPLTNNAHWKPWYRQKGYKGNLTEDQKRYLDSFRNSEPHPATSFEELPEEVQSRLLELEEGLKDQQDTLSVLAILAWTAAGCYSLYKSFTEFNNLLTSGCLAVFGLAMAYMAYKAYHDYTLRHQHHNWYGDTEKGEPFSSTDEALQRHWEINALTAYRRGKDDFN